MGQPVLQYGIITWSYWETQMFILLKSYIQGKKKQEYSSDAWMAFVLNIVSISSKIKFEFLGQISSYTNLLSCSIWNMPIWIDSL